MPKTKTPAHDGDTVKALREAKGWSAYRLAQESGVGTTTISRIEREGGLTLRVARALCRALDTDLLAFWPGPASQ
jgi:transcriptional regulator with XRE-family HTH domain